MASLQDNPNLRNLVQRGQEERQVPDPAGVQGSRAAGHCRFKRERTMKAVSKTMYSIRTFLVLAGLTVTLSGGAAAQRNANTDDWCRDESWGDDRHGFCEVREYTVQAAGATMTVD